MKTKLLYSIVITIFISACNHTLEYEHATIFNYNDFQEYNKLTGQVIKKEIFSVPLGIICKDSVLIMYNVKGDYAINSYNLNTWDNIGEYIDWGRGPEELLYIKTVTIHEDKIHIFDKMKSQLSIYNFNEFCQNQKVIPLVTYTISGIADGMILTQDNMLMATSRSYPESRLTLFDKEGNFNQNIGEMPQITNKSFTPREKIEGFVCDLNIFPNGNLVLTYKLTDLIELYSSDGKLLKRLHGPDHFFPAVKETKKDNLIRVRPEIGKERDSYQWRTIAGNELWCLYSGQIFDPKANPYTNMVFNKIMVFSSDLTPLRIYELDVPIRSFTVDPNKKLIYGLQENSQEAFVIFSYY